MLLSDGNKHMILINGKKKKNTVFYSKIESKHKNPVTKKKSNTQKQEFSSKENTEEFRNCKKNKINMPAC